MKKRKFFNNLIGIPIIAISLLFAFATNSEASYWKNYPYTTTIYGRIRNSEISKTTIEFYIPYTCRYATHDGCGRTLQFGASTHTCYSGVTSATAHWIRREYVETR